MTIKKDYIAVFAADFSCPLQCFTCWTTRCRGTLEDQNQGCPWTTRTQCHCWGTAWVGSA